MLDEPDFLIIARQLAAEPLVCRFDTKNLTLAFFLESYAMKFLTRFMSGGKFTGIQPIPLVKEDIEGPVRARLDPMMADIATGDLLPHADWIKQNLIYDHLMEFMALCKQGMMRRWARRAKEAQIIEGAQLLAFFLANLIRLVIVIVAVRLDAYWMIGMMVLTMFLAAYVVGKGNLKLT